MEKIQRIRRRKTQEAAVEMVINILENKIGPRFSAKKKYLLKKNIHKQVNNTYHKIFVKIIDYIDSVRLEHGCKNSFNDLAEDYLMSVYEYYWNFKRIPTLMQISPSANNQIRFDEWIDNYIREIGEEYWLYELPKVYEVIEVLIESNAIPEFIET